MQQKNSNEKVTRREHLANNFFITHLINSYFTQHIGSQYANFPNSLNNRFIFNMEKETLKKNNLFLSNYVFDIFLKQIFNKL